MEFLLDTITSFFPEPHASLIAGILLGAPLKTVPFFVGDLKTVGLMHLVVLSGMNISILTSLVFDMTRTWGKFLSSSIAIGIILSFVLFVGPQPPLIRAACMAILTVLARITGRRSTGVWNLFLALLVILLFRPQWLSSLSFQLSFGATLGIILFSANNHAEMKGLRSILINELRTSLAAQIFTAPLIFISFKQISFISPFANILVSWTIVPLMVVGILFLVVSSLIPILAFIPGVIVYGLLAYIIWVIRILAKIPFAFVQL